MKKKFTMLFALLLCCVGVAWAQSASVLEDGKTYYLKVVGTDEVSYIDTKTNHEEGNNRGGTIAISTEAVATYFTKTADGKWLISSESGYLHFRDWDVNAGKTEAEATKWTVESTADAGVFYLRHGAENSSTYLGTGTNLSVGANLYANKGRGGAIKFQIIDAQSGDVVQYIPADKAALADAITDATEFVASIGFSFTKGAKVALTVGEGGNLTANYNAIDGDVLGNCIDGNPSTLFHSDWLANTNGGHYLQVDLGEGQSLDAFVLEYATRQSGNNGAPYSMTVSGSNDGKDFEPIVNLSKDDKINPLPAVNAKNFSTAIAAGEAYRYLRFTVNSSPNGNGSFGLAEFAIYGATMTRPTAENYSNRLTPLTNLHYMMALATECNDNASATQEEVNAVASLLEYATKGAEYKEYPFQLTTDANKPVCYLIKSARAMSENGQWGVPAYWEYQLAGNNAGLFTVEKYPNNDADKDVAAYWYFVENKDGHLELIPFMSPSAMGYTTVGNGDGKLTNNHSAQNFKGTAYSFVNSPVDKWGEYSYALKPFGYDNYVSNIYGYNYMMGFYNVLDDGGTRFTLVEAETPSSLLDDLNAAIVRAQSFTAGTKVGEYYAEGVEALAPVIAAAQTVLNDATTATDESCQQQIDALNAAIADVDVITFTADAYYRLICVAPKTGNGASQTYNTLTFDGNDNLVTSPTSASNVNQIFKFEDAGDGKYYLKSLNAGKYLNKISAGDYRTKVVAQSDACKLDLTQYNATQWKLHNSESSNGKHCLFAENEPENHANIKTVAYACAGWEGGANSASAWYLVPVTELEITINEFASICLPFGVEPGEGVKAYAIESTNSTHAILAEKADIPAGEGAILEGNGTVKLNLTEAGSNWDNNLLEGTTVNTNIDKAAYVLAKPEEKEIGLYRAKLTDGSFLNNANKAYLPADAVPSGAQALRFTRGGDDETTSIGNVQLINDNVVIYDLLGRRVEKMEKGIYIVNGKKVIR